jgi:hypothetical protein
MSFNGAPSFIWGTERKETKSLRLSSFLILHRVKFFDFPNILTEPSYDVIISLFEIQTPNEYFATTGHPVVIIEKVLEFGYDEEEMNLLLCANED